MSVVIRKCEKCGYKAKAREFSYLGDRVFACPRCGSKWTHVDDVIEEDADDAS